MNLNNNIIIPCERKDLKPNTIVNINGARALATRYNKETDLWQCVFAIDKDGKTGVDGWYDFKTAKVGCLKELKFRAKPIDANQSQDGIWVYGLLQQDSFPGCYKMKTGEKCISIDSTTIGQYTRRNDDNGNEIYEGDIVSVESIMPYDGSVIKQTITIDDITNYEVMEVFIGAESLKVIGNIYEEKEAGLGVDQEDEPERE